MIANALLALALTQGCPQPASAYDPPPCAAMNVRGCLPGYTPTRDAYGRLVYACDSAYAYGQVAPAPQGRLPPRWEMPPADAPAYAPPPAAPAPTPAPMADVPPRGRVAIVLMPGATSGLERTDARRDRRWDRELGAAGLELRGRDGGARVRLAVQYAEFGRLAELTLKYDFLDGSPIRPFIGFGIGAASVDPLPGWRPSGSAVAGLDVYLSRNVFLTAEVQGRRFAARTAGGRGLEVTSLKQSAGLLGIGIYL